MSETTIHSLREEILSKKRAGCAFPLISLSTKHAFECGDFYTLLTMKDWALQTGLSIIQILPLNDLGWGRSPYSSISAFAIDPTYISLHMLGINIYSRSKYIKSCKINIRRVRDLKLGYLQKAFSKDWGEEMQKNIDEFRKQQTWLDTYVAFKILYEENNSYHWKFWPEFSNYEKGVESIIQERFRERFYFYAWVQLLAFQQLQKVKKEFETAGIFLKGDMPILTSPNSADVWSRRHLFFMDLAAGAPPDYFNSDGQNWGFPVINWEVMKKDNYSWWRERLSYIENFYHIYRIDHVLGMYRIWAISGEGLPGKKGFFYPQHGVSKEDFEEVELDIKEFEEAGLIYEYEKGKYIFYWDFHLYPGYQALTEEIKAKFYPLSYKYIKEDETYWKASGEDVLDFLFSHSNMLPCAEDLGAVPGFVRDSIHERKIIGMDVIRWTRSFETGEFIPAEKYRENAVSALSVHDTSIALAWWHEIQDFDRKAFLKLLELKEEPKAEELLEEMLAFSLSTNSQFSINLLHDFISERGLQYDKENEDELDILVQPELHRINIPGTPEKKNWGYRYPFHAENLLENNKLTKKIARLVAKYRS
ncbi:MAG: 4-alpha-glucanotransferase [Leptospiraceae bacterium]|nr:4-alpha-glucanotransferase [Leptospiraceae bacterium]MCP5500012.1 4-alpha-glucanotransferase [Leptospiraceae bacterium]